MSQQTHFGFKQVPEEEKASMVAQVFHNVASRYDIMNDLMSGGLHRIWKNNFITQLNPAPNTHLLDVAGGTGDIAFRFLKSVPTSNVTILDINPSMLTIGKQNAINRNILKGIDWVCADAQSIPFPDNHFDYYTIAFGIRNVTDIPAALAEAKRVLKPGGRFLCLEFSKVNNPLLKSGYDFYSFNVIPKIGEYVTQDKESYQYLVESIRMFPNQHDFKKLIEEAGFTSVTYRNLSGGIVAIHSGWKV